MSGPICEPAVGVIRKHILSSDLLMYVGLRCD